MNFTTSEDKKMKQIPVTSCGSQGAGVQKNHLHSLRTCGKPRMRTTHLRGGSSSELKCLPGTLAPFLVDMTDACLEQFKEGRIYLGSWLKGILSMRRGWGQHGWWGEGM